MVLSLWPLFGAPFLAHSVGGNTVSNAYWLPRCLYTLRKNTIVRACRYLAYICRGNEQYTMDCLASSTLSTSFYYSEIIIYTYLVRPVRLRPIRRRYRWCSPCTWQSRCRSVSLVEPPPAGSRWCFQTKPLRLSTVRVDIKTLYANNVVFY